MVDQGEGAPVPPAVSEVRVAQARRASGKTVEEVGKHHRVEIHGDNWSTLNHYLLRVMVDTAGPGFSLEEVLPPEAEVRAIGAYDLLDEWLKNENETE